MYLKLLWSTVAIGESHKTLMLYNMFITETKLQLESLQREPGQVLESGWTVCVEYSVVWTSLGLRRKTAQGRWLRSGGITLLDSGREAALLPHLHFPSHSHHLRMQWPGSPLVWCLNPFSLDLCEFAFFPCCLELICVILWLFSLVISHLSPKWAFILNVLQYFL